jgi:hypothetical protein
MRIREVQEATHPDDVNASAGMYAFGDMMLVMYLAFLFLILTGLLLWLLS